MYKKFRFVYLMTLLFSLQPTAAVFAQAKKPLQKKFIPVKKPAIITKVKSKPAAIRIKISTDSGIIIVKLSDSTPLHRDNFVKLVKEKFYDSLLFHRVIPGYIIQGGDPASKHAQPGTMLGFGGDSMARIPAEIKPSLYHKKGVLAAARDDNPAKASSACQFYLVEGKIFTDDELFRLEQQKGIKYPLEQKNIYKTIGGTPNLDGAYTVFGEVESGIEVIGKISSVPRDAKNRPMGDIKMKMEMIR